jgi:FkbM family methyltransferase
VSVIRESLLRRAIRGLAIRSMAWVEETNIWDSSKNGELLVLREALRFYKAGSREHDFIAIDAGANKGDYIAMVDFEARAVDAPYRLHAFEPQVESYSQLISRFGQHAKISINQLALSDREGEGVIYSDAKGSPLASLHQRDLRAVDLEMSLQEKIRVIRLASYIREAGLKHIHFLKIDVEGSEFAVLNGTEDFLRPDFVDFIQFEYGGTNLDARVPLKAFFDCLEQKGFVVAKVMSAGLRVKGYSPWMDNYLYANYVALSKVAFKYLADRS